MKTNRILLFLFITLVTISCKKDDREPSQYSSASSIIVNNGKVLVSGWKYAEKKLSTMYWINSSESDSTTFINLLTEGDIYKESIDRLFRTSYVYKALNGEIETYKFNQRGSVEEREIFYYKNNEVIRMDTTALGVIATLSIVEGKPFFAGSFGEMTEQVTGKLFTHVRPFFWDGASTLIEMPVPDKTVFKGVSCLYVDNENNTYIGGLTNVVPMYWKNSEPIILSSQYGEVNQIIVSDGDVYAVGLINKHNSNSTRHTAGYWKNEEYHELEDNAQAYGIYIDGNDIYVAGSVGNVPSQYRACYWKNGVRVDL